MAHLFRLVAVLLVALLVPAIPTAQAQTGNSAAFNLAERTPSQSWTLYVPREAALTAEITLTGGAYTGLSFSGPGTCFTETLGTGATAHPVGDTVVTLSCGRVPLGWYSVSLSLGHGLAGGHLRFDSGTLLF
jgi:hypothetical protein